MKILINDHSGHGFTLSLSKELANEHTVLHCFSKNFQSPKGYLLKSATDPSTLFFHPLAYRGGFKKYSLLKRIIQERKYADMLNSIIAVEKPDVVICANTPLVAQQRILRFCKKKNIPFIFWCQDIYSLAIKKIAIRKAGWFGYLIAKPFELLEKYQLRNSDCIITITEDFDQHLKSWSIETPKYVIPNWSPIKDFCITSKTNSFSERFGLTHSFNIVYSGTLGLKHNPQILVDLCKKLAPQNDIKVVVVSEGLGASFLEKEKMRFNLSNLILLPFQPFEAFSSVLSTADIFIALLENEAGQYSVPSKVLSYLCAGKPIILAAPAENLASKIIVSTNSGLSMANADYNVLAKAILEIKGNSLLCKLYSENARKYAEQNFQIEHISERFLNIIYECTGKANVANDVYGR